MNAKQLRQRKSRGLASACARESMRGNTSNIIMETLISLHNIYCKRINAESGNSGSLPARASVNRFAEQLIQTCADPKRRMQNIHTYSRSVVCTGCSAAGRRACQYATANTKPCALVLYMRDIALAHAQATIHCMNN